MLITILTVITILSGYIAYKIDADDFCAAWAFTFIAAIVSGLILICAIFVAVQTKMTEEAFTASQTALYDSLTYQLQNDVYDNENDIGKAELYAQITVYNAEIAKGKAMNNNYWLGIFYYDYYDQLEFIDITGIKQK